MNLLAVVVKVGSVVADWEVDSVVEGSVAVVGGLVGGSVRGTCGRR